MSQRKYSKTTKRGKGSSDAKGKNTPYVPGNTVDTRKDIMDRNKSDFPNDPLWYYGDATIGDEISRFSFNQFAGLTDARLASRAGNSGEQLEEFIGKGTICVLPLNPSPGTTYVVNGMSQLEMDSFRHRGINQSLQAWWSLLTSRAGRGATYSKVDLGMLILAMGEVISTIEHLRRAVGIAFTYSLRNRVLPNGLLEAMGFDADDFLANLADYRLRLNSLILRVNKMPIPGNIPYFQKCQDLYQKIFVDSGSEMCQFYVLVPATTWVLKEQLSQSGTVLQTAPMFFDVDSTEDGFAYDGIAFQQTSRIKNRTFSDYLDVLETQLNALIGSTTYSNIYSDMINAASLGTIKLWTFELVPENYAVTPEYSEMMCLMIHNAMAMGAIGHKDIDVVRNKIDTGSSYYNRFEFGTPLNDVYTDPDLDIIVHNPSFIARRPTNGATGSNTSVAAEPIVFDMLTPNPDNQTRIEAGVFKVGCSGQDTHVLIGDALYATYDYTAEPVISGMTSDFAKVFNADLPDHYVVCFYVYTDVGDGLKHHLCVTGAAFTYPGNKIQATPLATPLHNLFVAPITSVFQWFPIYYSPRVLMNSADTLWAWISCNGELNYWTILDQEWFRQVNDAKYIGLFTMR